MKNKTAKNNTQKFNPEKFYDASTGIKGFVDKNGSLRLVDVPIMKSGKLKQCIDLVEDFGSWHMKTITDDDRHRGWVWCYRSDADVFRKKTMESFVGIPVMRRSNHRMCAYNMDHEYYRKDGEEPGVSPSPIGTVTAARRGKSARKNCLLVDIVIWNVHALAEAIIGRYAAGITSGMYLSQKCINMNEVRIKQTNIIASHLYLTHGDVYGINILDKNSKFYKWFKKRFLNKIVINKEELFRSEDKMEPQPPEEKPTKKRNRK